MKFSGKMMRDLALLLALVLVMSSLTVGICALGDQRGTPKAAETETKAAEDTDGSIQDIFTQSDAAQFKDETVYVLTDANGTVNKVIVSDWIKNSAGDSTIRDTSGLSDIQVTKGDATYTLDGDNLCVWDTKGGDVYYQGTSDQEIPVSMKLTYTLDGSPVAAEDLAGKSGKVTIRFDYENQQKQTVQIDGKNTQMYVPFLMLTGLALDNSKFTNITVTNGKVINDGERSLVVGCALPGMQEDLDVDTDTLEVPDYVEITADVTDFELTTTVTLAANNFLSSLDLDSVSTLDDLEKALTTLDDSTAKLLDGATKLSEGLTTLLDESGSLVEGIGKLQEVASGASSVNTNLGTLRGYLQQLDTGLNTLSGKSSALNEGAKQTFAALLSSADTQLAAAGLQLPALTIDNYGTVLDGAVAGMTGDAAYQTAYNKAYATVSAAVEANRETVTAAVTAAVKQQVLQQVLQAQGYTLEQYNASPALRTAVDAAVDAQMQTAAVQQTISDNVAAQMQALIDQTMQSTEVQSQIAAGQAQIEAGAKTLSALKQQLDTYNTFYQGIQAYTGGVDSAASSTKKINAGVDALLAGTGSLASGANTLWQKMDAGAGELTKGVTELKDGSKTLAEGMQTFYDEGIHKLLTAYQDDISPLLARLRAMVDVSKTYSNYSGISDGMDGSVKFIYRTDSIEKDED